MVSFSAQLLCHFSVPENAILAFGNGSDVKTGASQAGMASPATDQHSTYFASTTPGVIMETEQNTLRAQIPAQVRWDDVTCGPNKRALMEMALLRTGSHYTADSLGVFVLFHGRLADGWDSHSA